MSPAPLFSIVTVCLNCKDKLIITAQSVLAQTFNNFEYIIKDGASTDSTEKILGKIGADLIVSSKDSGIFDGMNKAINLSSGRYIYFLNAGDVFVDQHVLHDVAAEIQKHPDVELFYGDIISPRSKRKYIFYKKKITRYQLYTSTVCHQAWFLSRSVYLQNGGFDATQQIGGDYLLLLRIILEQKIRTRHIRRFVAIYEGGGVSADPILVKRSEKWRQEARDGIFPRIEARVYSLVWYMGNLMKRLTYDRVLFRIYRRWCHLRFVIRGK